MRISALPIVVSPVSTDFLVGDFGSPTASTQRVSLSSLKSWLGLGAVISGGTIDATPIGNTTPSTGKFTTLSATGGTIVTPVAFASLPAAPVAGQRAMINNSAAAPAFLSAAAGGGAVTVPVFYNGTAWLVG